MLTHTSKEQENLEYWLIFSNKNDKMWEKTAE